MLVVYYLLTLTVKWALGRHATIVLSNREDMQVDLM